MKDTAYLTFVATQAALHAGEILRRGFGTLFQINRKEGHQNLVTEYDLAAESAIISFVRTHFPDHSFLAEESGTTHQSASPITWIIDPLDGTVNFAHNIPMFSVSIGVAVQGKIVSGVVYHPLLNELFVAELGKGAYLNGHKLRVSESKNAKDSLLATGFPYDVHKNPLECIDHFAAITHKGIHTRRLGSAALDLAYVAAGRYDGYWEVELHPWDLAAGKLLVEEAGGKVTHYDGSPHEVFCHKSTLATNGLIHNQMQELLKP